MVFLPTTKREIKMKMSLLVLEVNANGTALVTEQQFPNFLVGKRLTDTQIVPFFNVAVTISTIENGFAVRYVEGDIDRGIAEGLLVGKYLASLASEEAPMGSAAEKAYKAIKSTV